MVRKTQSKEKPPKEEPNDKNPLRNWCFTSYAVEEKLDWEELSLAGVRYVVYQLEKCPDTGRMHYQGYMETKKGKRLAGMKKLPGLGGAHFSVRRGTRKQARDYCMKEESREEGPWEHGDFMGNQGSREELIGAVEMTKEGKTWTEIAEELPGAVRSINAIKAYRQELINDGTLKPKKVPRNSKTNVILYLGPPGTGKSYSINETWPEAYRKDPDKWWDDYAGEDVVVLDDFKGWLQHTQLQHILDPYPCKVEIKGGKVNFRSSTIVISSNYHPAEWYKGNEIRTDAILRRIDKIYIWTPIAVYKAQGDTWQERAAWLNHMWHGALDMGETKAKVRQHKEATEEAMAIAAARREAEEKAEQEKRARNLKRTRTCKADMQAKRSKKM